MKTKYNRILTLILVLLVQIAFAQEKIVTGVVSDESGSLPGVTVLIKGTNTGTQTDFDGNYSIKATTGNVLVFSYVGMEPVEKTVGTLNTINVTMNGSNILEEIVIVGYGSTAKKDLTGSISTISSDDLKDKPVASLAQALQGKSAGLQIVSTGGRTGDGTQISIRGNGSLSASNSALYVIDGVPQETMGSVTSEDIKSISILKDAASTAIYGSRASNGVVLIETKKGNYNQETTVSVTTSYGFQDIIKKPSLLNAQQYKQVLDAARINYENDIANGDLAGPKNPAELIPLPNSTVDTDWLSLVLKNNPIIKNTQLSVAGGGENTKAYLSGSLFNQEGIIKDDSYKKARLRLNVEQKVNKYINIGIHSYFSYSEAVPVADDNNTYQPYSKALEARPDLSPYDADGKIGNYNFVNPLYAFERQLTDKWQDVGGTFYFDVTPIDGLVWHSSYSGNIANNRYNRFDAPNTKRGLNGDGVPTGYGYYGTTNNRDYQVENTVTYATKFFDSKLKFNLLGGHSFQKWSYEDSYVQGENFPSNDLKWLVSAGEINKGRSYIKEMSLESYFTRMQLSMSDKYHLMISTRYDGSSKFTEENRWGNFPAISAGWTISNEEYFTVPAINSLKLRASFGFTGNQTGISYASGQNLIGSGENYDQEPGLAATNIFNPNLTWEKGKALNLGINLTLLNRFDVTLDYYNKETQDLLSYINVPQESGYRTMLTNVGNISNKGFEIDLNAKIVKSEDFKWDLGVNFSYNDNKVISIGTEEGQYTTGFVSIVKEGESLGSFYVWEAAGIADSKYTYKDADGVDGISVAAGDMLYVDQNGDGQINDDDKKVFSGGIAPIYGGLHTQMSYKGLDFAISSQYSLGKKVYAYYKKGSLNGGSVGAPSYSENMITEILDYWTPENTDASIPRPHLNSSIASWNTEHSSRFIENADYLRISDITLGFNFKSLKNVDLNFVKSMRVYVQARNPFTFTKYSGGDPEVNYVDQTSEKSQDRSDTSKIQAGVDLGGIPNIKSFLIGININI